MWWHDQILNILYIIVFFLATCPDHNYNHKYLLKMNYTIHGLLDQLSVRGVCVCPPSNLTCKFLPNEIQQIKHNTPWEDWSPLWKVRLASELVSGISDDVHLTPGSWAVARAAVSLDQNLHHGTVFTQSVTDSCL